eukprot:m51a1_g6502 putative adenylate guanylate cyclase (1158) ;mRNA; f:210040-215473
MKVSFRALLVATVCAAVWVPMVAVLVLFNERSLAILRSSNEQRLLPVATRFGDTVSASLQLAERVARQTAADFSSGALVFDDSPRGLHELRARWHSVLRAYNATSDIGFITAEGSERPACLYCLGEFSSGDNLWWSAGEHSESIEWRLDMATLDPVALEWVNPTSTIEYLPMVAGSLPAGADECWMPVYVQIGDVWASYVAKAFYANTTGPGRPVWAYVFADLVLGDIVKVFSGLTVADGLALLVDSASSTLLGATSRDVPTFRDVGDDRVAVLANETAGNTSAQRRAAAVDELVRREYGSWLGLSLALGDDPSRPADARRLVVAGARMLVSFAHVRRPCMSWVVAVVAEERSVSVDVAPVVAAVCATVGALAVLVALSVLLTRPLAKLSRRMDSVARLTFTEGPEGSASVFSEFEELNGSFRQLSAGIAAMTRYVPMPVVVQIMTGRSDAAPRASGEGALALEVRRVTIMFCDIRGFTTLSERHDTQAVVRVLFEWLGAYTRVIVKNGGVVDKYIGDTAADFSSGALVFDDSPRGLHELRARWHSVLGAYNATSDIGFITAEGSERPACLYCLGEFSSGDNLWWSAGEHSESIEWRLDMATLDPVALEWVNPTSTIEYLPMVAGSLPAGADECWMPVYVQIGDVWASYVAKAFYANTTGPGRPVWAYVFADLVLGDIVKVFSGLTVADGLALLVDSASSTLLGATSRDVPTFRDVGDDRVAVLANETAGNTSAQRRAAAVDELVRREYGSWLGLSLALGDDPSRPADARRLVVAGARMLVSFAHVRRPCMSWVVAVVAEERSVSVDVAPVVAAVCATVGALAVLVALSVLLTRPLAKLSRRMDSVARLTFTEGPEGSASVFSEFEELNGSFRQLSAGIAAMTRYVPMPVVVQIMTGRSDAAPRASGEGALALEVRRVTIMFCDIRGFTTLSERHDTQAVVRVLFEWLGAYTRVIVKNGGVVDKYIGDCIMALWNAPLDTAMPEAKACATAVEFRAELAALNEGFRCRGLPELSTRVGIHAGELFVGNIGCSEHVNYTVCGTPANIAARLEQLGKEYGVTPLVSGDVARSVRGVFVCAWVGDRAMRGDGGGAVGVFHLVGRAEEATPQQVRAAERMGAIAELRAAGTSARESVQSALEDPEMWEYRTALSLLSAQIN